MYDLFATFISPTPNVVPPSVPAPLSVNLLELFVNTIEFHFAPAVFASMNTVFEVVSMTAETLGTLEFTRLTKLFHVLSATSQSPTDTLPAVMLPLVSNSNVT